MTNPRIASAQALGQRLWLDDLNRGQLRNGELARLLQAGVTGITSNPTIFQRSVARAGDYDAGIERLAAAGYGPDQMLWELMIEDVREAADLFHPVFERSGGRDGFVSIEVSPEVAHSTDRTVEMARELRRRCDRPNVMVKIPATRQGLSAIREMVGEGANINVTLIFSVSRYADVVEAFLSGLETLMDRGGDVAQVNSVASFFVSRVDARVDALIDAAAGRASVEDREALQGLRGKTGIVNCKLAFERFTALHAGPRWERLEAAGARAQRCLWASTSVKDPTYPDTLYVDNLMGPATIDTMPRETLDAFVDHGVVRNRLEEGVDAAHHQVAELARLGIDLQRVTADLEDEGVETFARSYQDLRIALSEASRHHETAARAREFRDG